MPHPFHKKTQKSRDTCFDKRTAAVLFQQPLPQRRHFSHTSLGPGIGPKWRRVPGVENAFVKYVRSAVFFLPAPSRMLECAQADHCIFGII